MSDHFPRLTLYSPTPRNSEPTSPPVLLLEVPRADFGSMALANLQQLRDQSMRAVQETPKCECVILDISRATKLGAAFLGLLVILKRRLQTQGYLFLVYGDRWGLLRTSGLDRVIDQVRSLPQAKTTAIRLHTVPQEATSWHDRTVEVVRIDDGNMTNAKPHFSCESAYPGEYLG